MPQVCGSSKTLRIRRWQLVAYQRVFYAKLPNKLEEQFNIEELTKNISQII